MSAVTLLQKGLRVIATRPLQTASYLRSYVLFTVTHLFRGLAFGSGSGVKFGKNVRIQRLRTVSAERPGATVELGDHCVVYEHAHLDAFGNGRISIGSHCIIGDVRIQAREKITVGARCVFSWNVFIQDYAPHPINPDERARQIISMAEHMMPTFDGAVPGAPPYKTTFPTTPIELGDDIWFGANCTILPGVKIGRGSIVAAGAVVVRGDYPPGSILGGNPAKIIKSLPV